jgi:hypothetical protein
MGRDGAPLRGERVELDRVVSGKDRDFRTVRVLQLTQPALVGERSAAAYRRD